MWVDAQQRVQERHWPAVERLLSALPPRLFRQVKLLEYDLALRHSSTGELRDVFLGVDQFPLLSIGPWLLDDLGAPSGPEREGAERNLFLTALMLGARSHAIEGIFDATSFYDEEHLAIVQWLADQATSELARVVPAGSPFWETRRSLALEDLERMLEERERRREPHTLDDPEAYLAARWSSPARLLAQAAATLAGDAEIDPRAAAMLDALAAGWQIGADLATMPHDLEAGRPSYPIALTARAAGLPLRPWPRPEVVLGAMVVTRSVEPILEAALARLRESRRFALELRLPTFVAYLDDVIAHHDDRLRGLSADAPPAAAASDRASRAAPMIAAAEPTLPRALAMAEGFLLADPTFRESWETHREGMFGSAEVFSRYPEGLILEILSSQGHDLARRVEDFLAFTAANGFRYFAHPWSGIDSDTVGVFLRLQRYATAPGRHATALDAVLGCLERDVLASGIVPVWITGCDGVDPARSPVIDLGEGCGTAAAHLLTGLIDHASEAYRDAIGRGSVHLLARIAEVGLGANVNYPPPYALAAFLRLIARLGELDLEGLLEAAGEARRVLVAELERACRRRRIGPQEAALLTIACFDAERPDLVEPAWATTILKRQRFDGGWGAEPFAAAPNRGGSVTWYSSTTLTSAFCYDALRRTSQRRDGAPGPALGRLTAGVS